VLGEAFSIADCHLYTICTWLEGDGVRLADYPKLQTFMAAMEARDSVRAVHAKGML
jgi:glutathione S-transferase